MTAKTIAVIGTVNPEIITGPLPDLPEWGRQTRTPHTEIVYAGSAARVAYPLRQLGYPVAVVGVVGGDALGEGCVRELAARGVNTEGIEVLAGERTASCVALVREDGQRVYLSDVGIMDRFDEALLRRHLEQLGACDFVLLTGLFSITGLALPGVGRVFAELRARGVVTLLDTGWHMEGWPEAVRGDLRGLLRETDYVLPNLEEIAGMTNATGRPEALLRALREAGARGIFLKLGEAGAAGLIGEEMMAAAAVPIVPRNTTAAGECFNAGVLHGLAQGWLPAAVLSFANRLAAHYVATGEYAAEAAVPPEPTP